MPADHYCIDPLSRVDWEEIQRLIGNKRYFVLHAPRQTDKTSILLAMMEVLSQAGDYIYVNIETAQEASRGNVEAGIATVCSSVALSAEVYLQDSSLQEWLNQKGHQTPAENRLGALLGFWASHSTKPIVLMLDEVDALMGTR